MLQCRCGGGLSEPRVAGGEPTDGAAHAVSQRGDPVDAILLGNHLKQKMVHFIFKVGTAVLGARV